LGTNKVPRPGNGICFLEIALNCTVGCFWQIPAGFSV
jgi:hypothetical protein